MKWDIYGGVEVRDTSQGRIDDAAEWWTVINVEVLLNQNYTLFGSLFGVCNPTSFLPIAEGRDLPNDASEQFKRETDTEGYLDHTFVTWKELQEVDWQEIGLYDDTEQITRRAALGASGELLLELMGKLAECYGTQNVRLVVWFNYFDNGYPKKLKAWLKSEAFKTWMEADFPTLSPDFLDR